VHYRNGSEPHRRVILKKSSTGYNLIDVADRFPELQRDHGLVRSAGSDELRCYLDDVLIQARYPIGYASTFFYTVSRKYFTERGCTMCKHDTDVKCFMKMVSSGAQPTWITLPSWRDPRLLEAKPAARVRRIPPASAALAAPTEAARMQNLKRAWSSVVVAALG
jgi:hypothetical protein